MAEGQWNYANVRFFKEKVYPCFPEMAMQSFEIDRITECKTLNPGHT